MIMMPCIAPSALMSLFALIVPQVVEHLSLVRCPCDDFSFPNMGSGGGACTPNGPKVLF